MTISELIAQLQNFPQDAEVSCWALYENGSPMDDPANMVEIIGLAHTYEDDIVFLNVTVGVNPEDFR